MHDDMRATGRTTRMINTAVARSLAGDDQIIYCANGQEIRRIKHQFKEAGGDTSRVYFITPNSKTARGLDGAILWDHYAIDVWERQEIALVRERANAIRRAQP